MIYYYEVIECSEVDIDYQQVYDYIKEDNPSYNINRIYKDFLDNIEYYFECIYNRSDFIEIDNEECVELIKQDWRDWLYEKFGENWDEI